VSEIRDFAEKGKALTDQNAVDDRLEAIAQDIESLQATAILHIAERLAEARNIFRYRRDEGGFGGWVENRLHYSRDTAYNLLHVHERFGGQQSVELFDRFAPTILYLLAKPSTPESACDEVLTRAASGEKISVAEVKETIEEHVSAAGKIEQDNNVCHIADFAPAETSITLADTGAKPSPRAAVTPTRRHATPRFSKNHALLHRQVKLGEDFPRIQGTTLDHPPEMDALVHMKDHYAAAYRNIIERAVAGESVSAVDWLDHISVNRRAQFPLQPTAPTEPEPKPVGAGLAETTDVSLLQQRLRDTQLRLAATESERDRFQEQLKAATSGTPEALKALSAPERRRVLDNVVGISTAEEIRAALPAKVKADLVQDAVDLAVKLERDATHVLEEFAEDVCLAWATNEPTERKAQHVESLIRKFKRLGDVYPTPSRLRLNS
jgi:hypothetical protein